MPESFALLILVIAVAVGSGIVNGVNDAANATATVIGTRAIAPWAAVPMAAFLSFLGAVTGTVVTVTIWRLRL